MPAEYADPFDNDTTESAVGKPSEFVDPFDTPSAQPLKTEEKKEDQPNVIEHTIATLQSVGSTIADVVTGRKQETEQTRGLKEFAPPIFDRSEGAGALDQVKQQGRVLGSNLGLATTFDPDGQVEILKQNFPELKFEADEKGNIIIDATAYGQGKALLNAPGLSPRDIAQMGFQIAAFTPAAKFAAGASKVLPRIAAAGGLSALTQSGMDVVGQALGRTEQVSGANIEGGDVALAGVFGAAGQGVVEGFTRIMRRMGFNAGQVQTIDDVTPEMKAAAQRAAKEVGVDPSTVDEETIVRAFQGQGLSDDVARNFAAGATPDEAVAGARQQAQEGTERFGIELSKGQRSGDPRQLQLEESIRKGGIGTERSQNVALAQQARQQSQAVGAAREIQSGMGGRPISSVNEAAEAAVDTVKTKADEFYSQVSDAYKAIPDDVALSTEGAESVMRGMKKALTGTDVATDLPQTAATLRDIRSLEKTFKAMRNSGARIPIQKLDAFRRRLGARIAEAQKGDQVQMIQVRNAFDEYVDEAVAKGLMSGERGADTLRALKDARALRRRYSELFEPQASRTRAGVRDNDSAGRLLNKMAELEPSTSEVVGAIFGSGRALGRKSSERLATRLRDVLGPDSDEWAQIKQAGFLRLLGAEAGQLDDGIRISGRELLKRVKEAKAGKGEGLARALFNADELDTMEEFARQVIRSQPDQFNPSGTAAQLGAQLRDVSGRLGQMLGFASGDPVTAMAYAVAQKGGKAVGDRKVTKAAEQIFSGRPLQVIKANPDLVAAVQGSAMTAEGQE